MLMLILTLTLTLILILRGACKRRYAVSFKTVLLTQCFNTVFLILSFQYCLLNTVFSHTVTHPHTPLWLERAPPRRPAPRLSWGGAASGVQRRWLLLGCCWAAAGRC